MWRGEPDLGADVGHSLPARPLGVARVACAAPWSSVCLFALHGRGPFQDELRRALGDVRVLLLPDHRYPRVPRVPSRPSRCTRGTFRTVVCDPPYRCLRFSVPLFAILRTVVCDSPYRCLRFSVPFFAIIRARILLLALHTRWAEQPIRPAGVKAVSIFAPLITTIQLVQVSSLPARP